MCMLCVIPPHTLPSKDMLEGSALNNPHGFGFAIAVPSEQRIIVEKTMDADQSIQRFLQLRTDYPEGYAIWHARYATHGSKTVENCHPFPVGHNNHTYLAHNGMLDIDIPKNDDRSDTRVFADDLLPAIGGVAALDNNLVFSMLEDWTRGSKVAVLTVDPQATHQLYLLNEASGWYDTNGIWWSNHTCYLYDWTTSYRKKADTNQGKLSLVGDDYVCPNTACGDIISAQDAELYRQCSTCGYCLDCMQLWNACLCYNSMNNDPSSAWAMGDY